MPPLPRAIPPVPLENIIAEPVLVTSSVVLAICRTYCNPVAAAVVTVRSLLAAVVPMPTLPLPSILSAAVPCVDNDSLPTAGLNRPVFVLPVKAYEGALGGVVPGEAKSGNVTDPPPL